MKLLVNTELDVGKIRTSQYIAAGRAVAPPTRVADDNAIACTARGSRTELSNSGVHANKVTRIEEAVRRALIPYVCSLVGAADKYSPIGEVSIGVRILATVKD